jgi:hypothetical protein
MDPNRGSNALQILLGGSQPPERKPDPILEILAQAQADKRRAEASRLAREEAAKRDAEKKK